MSSTSSNTKWTLLVDEDQTTATGKSSSATKRSTIVTRSKKKLKSSHDENIDRKVDLPPPIDLTIGERMRISSTIPFKQLTSQNHYIDRTGLIKEIYEELTKGIYLCYPRQTGKSTFIDSFLQWTKHDPKTRSNRLNLFTNSKIMSLAKAEKLPKADESSPSSSIGMATDDRTESQVTDDKSNTDTGSMDIDGIYGFNQHAVIFADFSPIPTEDIKKMKESIVKQFLNFLSDAYREIFDSKTVAEFSAKDPTDVSFFRDLIFRIEEQSSIPDMTAVVVIDNFDAPVLRILNRTRSTDKAKEIMEFLNSVLGIVDTVPGVDNQRFVKVILTGSHYPIGMNASHLVRFLVDWYPHSRLNFCKNFFFTEDDVNVLKERFKDTTPTQDLADRFGNFKIKNQDYFHPGCIVNYFLSKKKEDTITADSILWCTTDSLDILSAASGIEKYEMLIWLLKPNQVITFEFQELLNFEEIMLKENQAFSYLLQAGYLTEAGCSNSGLKTYKVTNIEVQNILAKRFRKWTNKDPSLPDPFRHFTAANPDYQSFFTETNDLLKEKYTGDDFKYEGNFHVFLASFFHLKNGWIFKSNYPAGYGRYDFIAYDESHTVEKGYVFEVAHITGASTDDEKNLKAIKDLLDVKWNQVLKNQYFIGVPKRVIHCVVVVGCRKRMHYRVYEISE